MMSDHANPADLAEPSDGADLTAALERFFGFTAFRPGQERVMAALLGGASAAAVFPTGGGKSLCYQLPALLLPGVTVVVSPLIALMKDQLDALRARDLPAARLDSSLELDEYRQVMGDLRSGRLKLLYVAPERFVNERFRQALGQVRLSMLAVDEAHCVSEWGHNFRPDYLKLAEHGRRLGAERVLALTATATPRVLADICSTFDIADENAVRTGFYRPNLELLTVPTTGADRDRLLVERVTARGPGPGIVYVTLRQTAERVTDLLRAAGVEARVYHAGLKPEERARTQDDFLASERMVVVATIAFGMGIDKSDLRSVDHYDLPKSLENWAQEIGRAGRDGAPSTCTLLACPDSLAALRNFAHGDVPDAAGVRGLVHAVFGNEERIILDLYRLSAEHDLRPLVVRTLLTYLELDGRLEAGTPLYDVYRFKPLASSAEILGRFQGERRDFLAALFRQATKRRVWLDLDLSAAARALDASRERLVRALDYLAEQGLLELQASKLRNPYRIVRRPDDLDALAASLHERTLALEARELERIEQVLALAALDGCRWNALCEHFGETRDAPCGHCSFCVDGAAPVLLEPAPVAIDDGLWRRADELRRERGDVLGPPRAFARFLVGLSSPRLTKARLGGHPLYGALAEVPFGDVLERAAAGG
ncbi:MAG: RecQ family ATP-dependent DNA helicase [Acidobacteriota bacterium]